MNNQRIADAFKRLTQKVERATSQLPYLIGNEAVNYSMESFAKQSWDGKAWDKRKSSKDANRLLLVKSARLKRSIRIVSTTATSVRWGTDMPYARVHNEGGLINRTERSETFVRNRYTRGAKAGSFKRGTTTGQGFTIRAHSYNMKQRQFLGINNELKSRIKTVTINHMQKAIR